MKQERLNKSTKLLEKSNTKAVPVNTRILPGNLKTMALALTNIENKLNILINNSLFKKLCIISGFLFISLNFANGQKYDFRKTRWGMNTKQVEASEMPNTSTFSENRLIYKDTIAGTLFTLVYTFNEKSELVSAKYILDKTYIDHSFYISEYNKFKELLTKKYGVPVKDLLNWVANVEDKDSSNWANSLESGYLQLISIWKTPKTNINLLVTKYDKVHLMIEYRAKNFKDYDISKYSTDNL